MKNNIGVCLIAALLVFASVLILSGCMYFINGSSVESKEYNPDEMSLPSVIEKTPTAQSEMQRKFSAYGYEETGKNGEKVFHLFTEEQIEESLQLYEDGVRRSLTYEEILFIINDSVRMYFEYDKIVIPRFSEYVKNPQSQIQYAGFKVNEETYEKCLRKSDTCREILTDHGDFSEYSSYISAMEAYSSIVYDIEAIIAERLRVHDTGSEFYRKSGSNPYNSSLIYGIVLDGGELSEAGNYEYVLQKNLKNSLYGSVMPYGKEYGSVIAKRKHEYNSASALVSIEYYENGNVTELFPTEQLKAMKPKGNITAIWRSEETIGHLPQRCIRFEFDRWGEKVTFSNRVFSSETVLKGTYRLDGDRMILEFAEGKTIILEFDGENIKPVGAYYPDGRVWLWFEESIVFRINGVSSGEEIIFPESFFER